MSDVLIDQTSYLIEYLVGPTDGRMQRCIRCLEVIEEGEMWERMWSSDGAYAIGIHVGCLPEVQAG